MLSFLSKGHWRNIAGGWGFTYCFQLLPQWSAVWVEGHSVSFCPSHRQGTCSPCSSSNKSTTCTRSPAHSGHSTLVHLPISRGPLSLGRLLLGGEFLHHPTGCKHTFSSLKPILGEGTSSKFFFPWVVSLSPGAPSSILFTSNTYSSMTA